MLTFHRVASSQQWERLPNRDFYVDIDFLDRFLSHLKRYKWDVVTIDEALRRSASDADNSRYVNFSIDDCYRDRFEILVPLFRRHNVPITLFVTTGIPDGTLPLWWAGLEDALLNNDRVILEDGAIDVPTSDDKRAAFHRIADRWDGPQAAASYKKF